ncbi:hypothetical protein BDV12DRAFT_178872 [Aspergillus spectabilis]
MADSPFPPKPYPPISAPAHRPKEMKVLVLGMSRTGTMSIYAALKQLSYNCYHMSECCLDSANSSLVLWNRAIEAKYYGKGTKFVGKDFDQMLWRYDAITDIPCILFVEELMDAYPDAQIVLNTRSRERWLPSMEHSFYTILSWRSWKALELLDPAFTRPYIPLLKSALSIWTGGDWKNRDRLIAGFDNHYNHVRAMARARGREVLEFRVQDGWTPLAKFLGKDIPESPFPHVNEKGFVVELHRGIFWGRASSVVQGKWPWVVLAAATAWVWWYSF